jgi:hypothetical protein
MHLELEKIMEAFQTQRGVEVNQLQHDYEGGERW